MLALLSGNIWIVIGFRFLWAGLFEWIVAGISLVLLIDDAVYVSDRLL